jgi:signal transduction histidine kinase
MRQHSARAADATDTPMDEPLGLGPLLLDTLGLAAAIEWHLHQFRKRTGVRYELTVSDAAGFNPPEDYAATIFDIYCEALGNVARHSSASQVAIALSITPQEVTFAVSLPLPRAP